MEAAGSITVNNNTNSATIGYGHTVWLKIRSTSAAGGTVKVSSVHGSDGVFLEPGDAIPLDYDASSGGATITLTSAGVCVLDFTKLR